MRDWREEPEVFLSAGVHENVRRPEDEAGGEGASAGLAALVGPAVSG